MNEKNMNTGLVTIGVVNAGFAVANACLGNVPLAVVNTVAAVGALGVATLPSTDGDQKDGK